MFMDKSVRWLRPVLAMIAGGMVAALLVVHNGRGAGFGSPGRVALLSGGDRSLWQKGYLWAVPGEGQNNDFERAQSLVDRRSKAMEAEKKSRHLDLEGRNEELLQAGRQDGLKVAGGQVLCGLGVGCEVENAKELDGAEHFDRKTVQKGHWDPKRMVSGDTVSEIGDAVDAYAHELEVTKEFNAGSPYNTFKSNPRSRQQLLREVFPPGFVRKISKILTGNGGQKLCIGAACEQWSDQQIAIAEGIDHDRVNQNKPDPPSDETMQEVQRAMNEQQIEKVSAPLPPY